MLDLTHIQDNEGLRLKPYKCTANKTTIGYGRNLEDKGITEEEAMYLFLHDIQDCMDSAHKIFDDFGSYKSNVKTVIIDMLYNLGSTRFCTFKKFIAAIKAGDLNEAAEQIRDSKYALQVPTRATRNINLLLR